MGRNGLGLSLLTRGHLSKVCLGRWRIQWKVSARVGVWNRRCDTIAFAQFQHSLLAIPRELFVAPPKENPDAEEDEEATNSAYDPSDDGANVGLLCTIVARS